MKAGLLLRPHLPHLVTTDLQVSRVTSTSRTVSAEVSGGHREGLSYSTSQVQVE